MEASYPQHLRLCLHPTARTSHASQADNTAYYGAASFPREGKRPRNRCCILTCCLPKCSTGGSGPQWGQTEELVLQGAHQPCLPLTCASTELGALGMKARPVLPAADSSCCPASAAGGGGGWSSRGLPVGPLTLLEPSSHGSWVCCLASPSWSPGCSWWPGDGGSGHPVDKGHRARLARYSWAPGCDTGKAACDNEWTEYSFLGMNCNHLTASCWGTGQANGEHAQTDLRARFLQC